LYPKLGEKKCFFFRRGRTDARTRHRQSIAPTKRRRLGQCGEFCLFGRQTLQIPCPGVVTRGRRARPRRPAPSPPPRHRGSRPERDAPVRLHTIRTRARGLAGRTKHGARRRHPSCGWQVDGPQAEVPALYSAWASYPRSRTRGVGRSRSRQRTGDVAGPVQRRLSDRRPMCAGLLPVGAFTA
jgi:hypothetical protein